MPWQDQLQPGSFRNVPFLWDEHDLKGGRRLAPFEFPLRDQPYVEDLGRKARVYRLAVYVLGDDYFAQRDALVAALELQNTAGTLVHPYLGRLTVYPSHFSLKESQKEGRMARFEMEFLEAGSAPSPVAATDTAGQAQAAADDASSTLSDDFAIAFDVGLTDSSGEPDFVQEAAASLIGQFASDAATLVGAANALVDVPATDVASVTQAVSGLSQGGTGLATDAPALAVQVAAIFTAQVTAIADAQAAQLAAAQAASPDVETDSRGNPAPLDPTYGVAAFATWGNDLPSVPTTTAARQQQAANQTAFVSLVQGAAIIAVAQIYAATDFDSSAAAETARTQLTEMIDAQAIVAGDAAQDDLYQAWLALYAAAASDLTVRGKRLPDVIQYQMPSPLPSLALAWRLYQDAPRAPELVARNAVIHPAFCPATGEALSD